MVLCQPEAMRTSPEMSDSVWEGVPRSHARRTRRGVPARSWRILASLRDARRPTSVWGRVIPGTWARPPVRQRGLQYIGASLAIVELWPSQT